MAEFWCPASEYQHVDPGFHGKEEGQEATVEEDFQTGFKEGSRMNPDSIYPSRVVPQGNWGNTSRFGISDCTQERPVYKGFLLLFLS